MINRKNTMNHEEYGYFIDIENNMTDYFPDNLKSMNEKYKIRSINKNYYKFNKFNVNINVNIMTTIPEMYENSSHSSNSYSYTCKKIQCSYDMIAIFILLLFVICLKCYYFLRNFV
jgi:hypothetical protein